MKLVVRELETPKEFEGAEEVQMSAWGMGPRGAAPKEVMIAINDNGGLVLGAFLGKEIVGFALTLVGYRAGTTYMYSHMTGVVKEHQSEGIGYLLKRKQREVCLERGFSCIAWTFDPIIARNAFFNFKKLGVVARNYLPDYYGPMNDSINVGWPTDRFLCEWLIEQRELDRVRAYARTPTKGAHVVIALRGSEPDAFCGDWKVDTGAERALVDIPSDVVALKARHPEEGKRWREVTREVFQTYFAAGYSAVALLKKRNGGLQYLLTRADLPPNVFEGH
ncbi:MAG: GNAT family N-acetyltransferase [Nitrososphaerales archaeon]|jgi:predicted GNAT superfamily acetyltransferase